MTKSHVVLGLVAKYREVRGQINEIRKELDRLEEQAQALHLSIKLFDSDYDVRAVRPKRKKVANQFFPVAGECTRFVLDVLREASGPLSTSEITDLAVERKNFENPDRQSLRACIMTTLSHQRKKEVVVEAGRDDIGTIRWRLAGQ